MLLSQTLMENKGKNLTDQQVEFARIIYSSWNDLLSLINEILDLSRIESGKLILSHSKVSLSNIESSLRDYFERLASDKGLEFTIIREKEAPEEIITDGQRLSQVLRNIMSNAVKFTEKGSIRVRIFNPGQDNEGKRQVAFSVKDTGIGIPAERQNDIFEAFQQLDGSTSRKYGGSGLGLSITRELTKLLGGRIELVSEPGKGSEFTVIIPAEPEATAETEESKAFIPEKPSVTSCYFRQKKDLLYT
jgi:signal transduction histidine kinase